MLIIIIIIIKNEKRRVEMLEAILKLRHYLFWNGYTMLT